MIRSHPEGTKWEPIAPIDPKDAEWVLERQFSIEEICRWYRIPPHKLQHLLRATFDNIAEQNIEYVTDTLQAWLKRWEAEIEIWRKLVPLPDQSVVFAEHTVEGLLQGNFEQQAKMFATGRQWGYMSVNDIRRKQNENSIGPDGDRYLEPENMHAVGEEQKEPKEPAPPEEEPEPGQRMLEPPDRPELRDFDPGPYIDAHLPTMTDAFGRLLRVEADKAERAAKRGELDKWAEKFYASHGEQVRGALIGPIDAFCGSLWLASRSYPMPDAMSRAVASCTADIVKRHVAESRAALRVDPIEDVLRSWRNGRAKLSAMIALQVLVRLLLPLIETR
jgi:hypothetical protein